MALLNRIALMIIAMNVLMCVFAEEMFWFYSGESDNNDPIKILEEDAMQEFDCYMHRASCTEEQKRIADAIREALRTNCRGCTRKQREQMRMITEWYESHLPENWKLILANIDL